jgi:hypothetical protein
VNSKNKNIGDLCRGINELKRGYQPRSNLVKDGNGDLLADFHNILNRWENYFSQVLNVHRVSDKSQGNDQIPAELIQARGETLWSEIHKLINSIWNKGKLRD